MSSKPSERLRLAQKQLRRHERLRERIEFLEGLVSDNRERAKEVIAVWRESRNRLQSAREELANYDAIANQLRERMREIQSGLDSEKQLRANARAIIQALELNGKAVPKQLREIAKRGIQQ